MKQKFIGKKFATVLLGVLCVFGMGQAAADNTSVGAVVQSYTAKSTLQNGMLVKLSGAKSVQVEPLTLASVADMTGVTVAPTDAPVTLSSQAAGNQVYVATSGRYEVLVSDQNGAVKTGDYITVSSLNGVGMKADGREDTVLGKAAGSFDGVHNVDSSARVRDPQGKTRTMHIGRVAVDITIEPSPLAKEGSSITGFLARASLLIANKQVSPWRTYVSVLVLLGCLCVSGILLYGGVRNGMVAIGRNPLARKGIMKNLAQVIVTSVVILVVGLFGAYLLLKL